MDPIYAMTQEWRALSKLGIEPRQRTWEQQRIAGRVHVLGLTRVEDERIWLSARAAGVAVGAIASGGMHVGLWDSQVRMEKSGSGAEGGVSAELAERLGALAERDPREVRLGLGRVSGAQERNCWMRRRGMPRRETPSPTWNVPGSSSGERQP